MVTLHAGRFVVVHLYLTFSVDPKNFYRGKFIPIFAAIDAHFLSKKGEIWYDDAALGLPPPSQIL